MVWSGIETDAWSRIWELLLFALPSQSFGILSRSPTFLLFGLCRFGLSGLGTAALHSQTKPLHVQSTKGFSEA